MSVADVTPRADSALLRSALTAAMHGWHVFPCAAGGKRPALRAEAERVAAARPGTRKPRASTVAHMLSGD